MTPLAALVAKVEEASAASGVPIRALSVSAANVQIHPEIEPDAPRPSIQDAHRLLAALGDGYHISDRELFVDDPFGTSGKVVDGVLFCVYRRIQGGVGDE